MNFQKNMITKDIDNVRTSIIGTPAGIIVQHINKRLTNLMETPVVSQLQALLSKEQQAIWTVKHGRKQQFNI